MASYPKCPTCGATGSLGAIHPPCACPVAPHVSNIVLQQPGFDTEHTMLIGLIRKWAHDRNLIHGATSQAQCLKLTEEVGEVAHAVARGDKALLKDAIGDVAVVLVILAAQNGLTFEECVASAYNEIKDRKGRMVDGIFVKDAA